MSGLFVAVVGPSGAGKDALIRALAGVHADDPEFRIVRRVVTRAADANEDHATLDPKTFAERARAGGFALTWEAHGLCYGVPAQVDDDLAAGRTLVGNLSRGAVAAARRRWPRVLAALVTASPATLAARLAARGREAEGDRKSRLARAEASAELTPDVVIENDGELSAAVRRLDAAIAARRGAP